jgi:farnesyl-diphosphate farnesyltransferase
MDLNGILRGTSRSFYLTLRVAPGAVRKQLGVAYLFCRAADTIADTALLPAARRRELLCLYRKQFAGESPDPEFAASLARELTGARAISEERLLLGGLEACFAAYRAFSVSDRALVRRLVATLTLGMEMDLECFPPARERAEEGRSEAREDLPLPAPLPDEAALDRYCYHVAGCVGEFWTDLAASHLRALSGWDLEPMRARGIRFGKGLQMTNVLRDLPRDLRQGRCYLPGTLLAGEGVEPAELRGGGSPDAPLPARLLPVLDKLLDVTLGHYRAAWEYTLSIPRRAPRLRLACAWPLLIGLETLELLRTRRKDLLRGALIKVERRRVGQLLRLSTLRVFSDRALGGLYRSLETRAMPAGPDVESRKSRVES